MTTFTFADQGQFWRFIEEVLGQPWQSRVKVRIHGHDGSCAVLVPEDAVPPDVAERWPQSATAPAPAKGAAQPLEFTLGELWTHARPVPRTPRQAASCYLLVINGDDDRLLRQATEEAPHELRLLTLKPHSTGSKAIRALRLTGDAGRAFCDLRQVPEQGRRAFECDALPSGALVAMPFGYAKPALPDALWPSDPALLCLYSSVGTPMEVTLYDISGETSLHELVAQETDAKPLSGLADPARTLNRVRWRIIEAPHSEPTERTPQSGRRKVVFRFRTAPTHQRGGVRWHAIGEDLLRALDECEVGILPEIEYAAANVNVRDEPERWHFLRVDEADAGLLERWYAVDRYDYLKSLEPHRLEVYLSTASRVVPPVEAILASDRGDGALTARLKALVGSPPDGTLSLLEHLPALDGAVSDTWKPCIIHLARAQFKPLADVLSLLLEDWHGNATAQGDALRRQGSVVALRKDIEQHLDTIGSQELEALKAACEDAARHLEEAARKALEAMTEAEAPVKQARELCGDLARHLQHATGSLEEWSTRLAHACRSVTEPRRAWISQATTAATEAIQATRPTQAEASSAAKAAGVAQLRLTAQVDALNGAANTFRGDLVPAISALGQRAAAAQEDADLAAREAQAAAAQRQEAIAAMHAVAQRALEQARGLHQALQQQLQAATEEQLRAQAQERANLELRNRLRQTEEETARALQSAKTLAQETIPALQGRIAALEAALAAYDLAALQKEERTLTERATDLDREEAALRKRADRLATEQGKLKDRLERAERDRERLDAEQASIEELNTRASDLEKSNNDRRKALRDRRDEAKERLRKAEQEAESIKREEAGRVASAPSATSPPRQALPPESRPMAVPVEPKIPARGAGVGGQRPTTVVGRVMAVLVSLVRKPPSPQQGGKP